MSDFVGEACESLFNLQKVANLLLKYDFKCIVLQFPDEHAAECVEVYDWIVSYLDACLGEGVDDVEVFVAADSTYGSSVDDISAEHVDSDVLVYFGSDLSSSGAIPVLVVPKLVQLDCAVCTREVSAQLSSLVVDLMSDSEYNQDCKYNAVITYEPGCASSLPMIVSSLTELHSNVDIVCADLPLCANLEQWVPDRISVTQEESSYLGGLKVPESITTELEHNQRRHSNSDLGRLSPMVIIYIGDKSEQLDSIALQCGHTPLIHFSPSSQSCVSLRGDETRAFRERFGGVLKVQKARIIGIIVGSMGLTGESTRGIITRLQTLCEAGGRKTYTFIMGRLNEAKLCNFPEVDLFCLISNEDTSVIAPKTFPVPVITPWELELGLEAREWASAYHTRPTAVIGDATSSTSLAETIEKVVEARRNNPYLSDIDDDDDDDGDRDGLSAGQQANSGVTLTEGELYREQEGENGEISSRKGQPFAHPDVPTEEVSALVKSEKKEGRLIEFRSAAGEFFAAREWQGLSAEVSVEEGASLEIQEGLSGIASGYRNQGAGRH